MKIIPDLYSEAKISPAGKVNKEDLSRWRDNLLVFLAPLGVMYLLQLSGALQNGALSLSSLVPTPTTLGAIQLYVVNGLLDLLRKFMDAKK